MEHWDHNACSGLASLGFGSISLMAGVAIIAAVLCLFSLGLI